MSVVAPDELVIREGADADSDAVIALINLCWSAYPGVVADVDAEEPGLKRVASYFGEQGGRVWTAWRGTALRGTVGYARRQAAGPVELLKLYVHPEERRSGLGRRLVALVEDAALATAAAAIELWTDTRFEAAHRFYTALGYRKTDEVRNLDDLSRSSEYRFELFLGRGASSAPQR